MKFGDIHDKGKSGALLAVNAYFYQEIEGKNVMVGKAVGTVMMGGIGGFGFKGKYPPLKVSKHADTKPDRIVEEQTFPQQTFLYRLRHDQNPLHVDIRVAKKCKYDNILFHGHCIHSITARVICEQYLDNDDSRLKSILVRFVKFLHPGELLIIKFWLKEGGVHFEVSVKKRNLIVMIGEANFS